MDSNGLILPLIFLFESFFSQASFSIILYALLLILSTLNLSSIRINKLGGNWIYAVVAYVLILTALFGWVV